MFGVAVRRELGPRFPACRRPRQRPDPASSCSRLNTSLGLTVGSGLGGRKNRLRGSIFCA